MIMRLGIRGGQLECSQLLARRHYLSFKYRGAPANICLHTDLQLLATPLRYRTGRDCAPLNSDTTASSERP